MPIRRATTDDIPAIVSLWAAATADAASCFCGLDPMEAEYAASVLATEGCGIYVLTDLADAATGFAIGRMAPPVAVFGGIVAASSADHYRLAHALATVATAAGCTEVTATVEVSRASRELDVFQSLGVFAYDPEGFTPLINGDPATRSISTVTASAALASVLAALQARIGE